MQAGGIDHMLEPGAQGKAELVNELTLGEGQGVVDRVQLMLHLVAHTLMH